MAYNVAVQYDTCNGGQAEGDVCKLPRTPATTRRAKCLASLSCLS